MGHQPRPDTRRASLTLSLTAPLFLALLPVVCSTGCQTGRAKAGGKTSERVEADLGVIEATIEELYAAFNFDPGEEPNWEVQRRIYLDDAVFVPPIRKDSEAMAQEKETFLAAFLEFATSEPYRSSGFHERIIGMRIDAFGGVAHAYVAFEGFVPGAAEAETRGLDSLQFVRVGGAWRLVSFATQYEGKALELPARFANR